MVCNRIRVRDFRNIEQAEVEFCEEVNILAGANAQGKTNLLEAIGYVALGKSFRTEHDEEMIRFGAGCAEVSVDFTDSQRRQNLTVRMMPGRRRRIEHNGVRAGRVSDVVGCFRTVLFCPEHLALVKDGPRARRTFLDVALSQLYPVYLKRLQRYNQILRQRNQLIRTAQDDPATFRDTAEFWSVQLAAEAAALARYRWHYLQSAAAEVSALFREMTGERETPELVYAGSSRQEPAEYGDEAATREVYTRLLTANWPRELAAGSTLWGVHKDDVEILLNGRPARVFASQGQQRSLALCLKLAEGAVCRQVCGELPVFLFDDVFSELDESRRAYLSGKLRGRQVIITSCEPGVTAGRVIRVQGGTYRPEVPPSVREESKAEPPAPGAASGDGKGTAPGKEAGDASGTERSTASGTEQETERENKSGNTAGTVKETVSGDASGPVEKSAQAPAQSGEESPAEKSAQFLTQSGEENPAGLPTQTPAQSVMERPAIRPARGSPAPPDGAGTG